MKNEKIYKKRKRLIMQSRSLGKTEVRKHISMVGYGKR